MLRKFPSRPETFAENSPHLLQAFVDAGRNGGSRLATLCHRLQFGSAGEAGSLGATDGRQLLVQRGFQFPWTGDVSRGPQQGLWLF